MKLKRQAELTCTSSTSLGLRTRLTDLLPSVNHFYSHKVECVGFKICEFCVVRESTRIMLNDSCRRCSRFCPNRSVTHSELHNVPVDSVLGVNDAFPFDVQSMWAFGNHDWRLQHSWCLERISCKAGPNLRTESSRCSSRKTDVVGGFGFEAIN